MKDEKKSTKKVSVKKTEEGTEKPRYNKTWQALIDNPIKMVVYDKTLFYR